MTSHAGLPRVLVVEDQAMLAFELCDTLRDAGIEPVGPAKSLDRALRLLQQDEVDAAVLDVNLGHERIDPVAAELDERHVPFIICTAYSVHGLPKSLRDAPQVPKPVDHRQLVSTLSSVLHTDGTYTDSY